MTSAAACPICGKPLDARPPDARSRGSKPPDPKTWPFCSRRCADVDLNRWLSGVYAVPATEDDDEDGETPKRPIRGE